MCTYIYIWIDDTVIIVMSLALSDCILDQTIQNVCADMWIDGMVSDYMRGGWGSQFLPKAVSNESCIIKIISM